MVRGALHLAAVSSDTPHAPVPLSGVSSGDSTDASVGQYLVAVRDRLNGAIAGRSRDERASGEAVVRSTGIQLPVEQETVSSGGLHVPVLLTRPCRRGAASEAVGVRCEVVSDGDHERGGE